MTHQKDKKDILGIKIDDVTMAEALSRIDLLIAGNVPSLVCTANANHLRLFKKDAEFAKIYEEADLVTVDGMSLVWVSHFLGTPLREKVSGVDLVVEICRNSASRNYKIYFLGAGLDVLKRAKEECLKLYPGIQIAGFYSPLREEILNDEKSKKIVEGINCSGANILCVAFGPPLQEKWIKKHLSSLKVPVSIGVGGAIDYLASHVKRPPVFIRKIGLEWIARLLQDPKRYWRRYLYDVLGARYLFFEILRSRRQKTSQKK